MSDLTTSGSGASAGSWLRRIVSNRALLLLGLTILLVVVVRVRLREMPLERDEGEYAYAGQLILQGVPPYQEVYNMKLPGTYAAYAVIMAVFGQTPAGIHFGLMLLNVGSIALVFLIGRRLLDDIAGAVAAASFALLSLSPSVLGLAGHATHFVAFFALAGTLLLMRATEGRKRQVVRSGHPLPAPVPPAMPPLPLFASGVLFGLAFLMKQHGIFFCLFGLAYLAWISFEKWRVLKAEALKNRSLARAPVAAPRLTVLAAKRAEGERSEVRSPKSEVRNGPPSLEVHSPQSTVDNPPGSPSSLVRSPSPEVHGPQSTVHSPSSTVYGLWSIVYGLLSFAAGLILPYLLTCLILLAAGVFHEFFFWTVTYARTYASAVPLVKGTDVLKGSLRAVVGPNFFFWLLPWIGAVMMWWDPRLSLRHRLLLGALLLCSVGSVSVGLYFREHYFITLLPVLGLLIGVAASRSIEWLRRDQRVELFAGMATLVALAIAIGASVIGTGDMWFGMSPVEVVRNTYGTTLYSEAIKVADEIKAGSGKNGRVGVLGSEPEIPFYAHRRSATGHIYMYPLMEQQPSAREMQEQVISDFERTRPEYMVLVDDNFSWLKRPDSETKILDWWNAWWPTNMDLVSTVRIQEGRDDEPSFGRRQGPEKTGPATLKRISVYARKK